MGCVIFFIVASVLVGLVGTGGEIALGGAIVGFVVGKQWAERRQRKQAMSPPTEKQLADLAALVDKTGLNEMGAFTPPEDKNSPSEWRSLGVTTTGEVEALISVLQKQVAMDDDYWPYLDYPGPENDAPWLGPDEAELNWHTRQKEAKQEGIQARTKRRIQKRGRKRETEKTLGKGRGGHD